MQLLTHPTSLTVAVDSPVWAVAGDPGVELAVADVALEAVLVVDLTLAEHLKTHVRSTSITTCSYFSS